MTEQKNKTRYATIFVCSCGYGIDMNLKLYTYVYKQKESAQPCKLIYNKQIFRRDRNEWRNIILHGSGPMRRRLAVYGIAQLRI